MKFRASRVSVIATGVVLLTSRPAVADNCGGLSDCYGTIAAAVVVLIAIVIVAVVLPWVLGALAAGGAEAAAGITLADSIAAGTVVEGGKLAAVLGAMETGFGAAAPTTLSGSLAVVGEAVASVGLETGVVVEGSLTGSSVVLQNVGGVLTTILESGEIIVTKGGEVLLHLIP